MPLVPLRGTSCYTVKVKVTPSCPTLCDPMDYTVHGILQARILKWVAFPFSSGFSQPRNWIRVSRIASRFFTNWAMMEVHYTLLLYFSRSCTVRLKVFSLFFVYVLCLFVFYNTFCVKIIINLFSSVQSLSRDPMNSSMPGLPVHHQFLEFTQTHVHRVSDAIQPSYPLSSPSPPASNPSQHQSLFQWVNSSHEVAKVLEFQL